MNCTIDEEQGTCYSLIRSNICSRKEWSYCRVSEIEGANYAGKARNNGKIEIQLSSRYIIDKP